MIRRTVRRLGIEMLHRFGAVRGRSSTGRCAWWEVGNAAKGCG